MHMPIAIVPRIDPSGEVLSISKTKIIKTIASKITKSNSKVIQRK
jgi:hypothetical protein